MRISSPYAKWKDHLLLLVFALIIYWPVSCMVLSLKNDAINYFLPIRYNVSESIQEGFFPWWTAYINLGYPLHGDMQSGVWNPLVLLMSVIRKYDIYWLHVETLLVVYISGITMYHLLKFLRLERKIAITVALAYMGCGYIVDAGQFLNWLYAAALLPLVFLTVVKCFNSFQTKDAFFFGFAHSLMFLCSYPADFILLSYLLFFYLAFTFYTRSKEKGWKHSAIIFARQISLSIFTFLLICLPAILSYIQFISHVDRGNGVSLERALSNSLAPANLISFLLPWATLQGKAFVETDPLIRNCYIGIILFAFFLFFLFDKKRDKTPLQKFLLGIFITALVFSLGKFAGLRQLTYYVLPLMNTFRHPANAKLFFIFSGQILAAFALQIFFTKGASSKLLKSLLIALAVLLSIVLLYGIIYSDLNTVLSKVIHGPLSAVAVKEIRDQLSSADYLLLNSLWALSFLGILARLLKKGLLKKYITALVFADAFIVAQFMLPLTYVSTTSPNEVESVLQQQPKRYPLPDMQTSLRSFSKESMKYFHLVGCLNPFNKQPGRADYPITPANLSLQDKFWDDSIFREKVLDQPLAFLADTIIPEKDKSFFGSNFYNGKAVLVDTLHTTSPKSHFNNNLVIKKFNPGHFEFEISNTEKSFFVLHQNYYPNWAMIVNGQPVEIIKANVSFMGGWIPAGRNKVQFIYKARHLKWLGIFSLLFAIIGLLVFSFKKIKTQT